MIKTAGPDRSSGLLFFYVFSEFFRFSYNTGNEIDRYHIVSYNSFIEKIDSRCFIYQERLRGVCIR